MNQHEDDVEISWRWVQVAAALLLIVISFGIITISAGYFDPKPIGDLQHTFELNPLSVDAGSSVINWLDKPSLNGTGTIRLRANHDYGEIDSGYGLALGSNQDQVIIAISPVGYLTIQRWSMNEGQTSETGQILPWQTWPHVRGQDAENEIWVDFEEGTITQIRVNQELLWQDNIPLSGDQLGLIAQSFGRQAGFKFLSIQHYLDQE